MLSKEHSKIILDFQNDGRSSFYSCLEASVVSIHLFRSNAIPKLTQIILAQSGTVSLR